MGKLVVIEGTDGCGKQTQTLLLQKRLHAEGFRTRLLSFPCYNSDSSALVKMYLTGRFGTSPDDVNRYAASAFYAVDRFASFKMDWQSDYADPDCVILCDRYTGSNAVHQGEKCPTPEELDEFLDWLHNFEFGRLRIPVPDLTIWLSVDPDITEKLMATRANKFTGDAKKDIHESDPAYLRRCRETGEKVAARWNWKPVQCADGSSMRPPDDIAEDVYNIVKNIL